MISEKICDKNAIKMVEGVKKYLWKFLWRIFEHNLAKLWRISTQ